MKLILKKAALIGLVAFTTHKLTLQNERNRIREISEQRTKKLLNRIARFGSA